MAASSGCTVEAVVEQALRRGLGWPGRIPRKRSQLPTFSPPPGLEGLNEGFEWASLATAVPEADLLGSA